MSNPGDDAREVMAKDRQRETLQPFDKMQPGEVDKVFQASCPQCDGRVWIFVQQDTAINEPAADPDCRQCKNCGYIHWLRGPNTSEVVPLRRVEPAETPKKDRVRALVHSLLTGGYDIERRGYMETVGLAERLDREIEDIK
jgi:hypothetical protein